jgi:hypothetical protein
MLTKKIKGVYYFRKVTPVALKEIIQRSELSLSFQTRDEVKAKILADMLAQILNAICVDFRFKLISKEEAISRLEALGFQCQPKNAAILASGQIDYGFLFRKFTKEQTNNGRWTLKTQKEYTASFAIFQRYCGETSHSGINRHFLIEYREMLQRLPPNIEKTKELKGKKIRFIRLKHTSFREAL